MTIGTSILDLIRMAILGYMPKFDPDRINIYNQKFKQPDDDGLFVTVEYRTSKILSVRSSFSTCQGQYQETIDINALEGLSIDLMSKNLEAYQMKELFLAAMNSYYAQGLQEQYGFKILRIAPINDLSALEASARLYRYEIPINVFTWYQNVTPAEFYDTINFQVIANGDPELKTPVLSIPTKQPIL